MIIAISTSSPWTSVALVDESGVVLAANREFAPVNASAAALKILDALIEQSGLTLSSATGFVADVGPGSFTGVKVAVVLAKTLGFTQKVKVAGVSSFDLIDSMRTTAVPCKKGQIFLKEPGQEACILSTLPLEGVAGYLPSGVEPTAGFEEQFPDASNVARIIGTLKFVSPYELTPDYRVEPSISIPKKPLIRA